MHEGEKVGKFIENHSLPSLFSLSDRANNSSLLQRTTGRETSISGKKTSKVEVESVVSISKVDTVVDMEVVAGKR